MRSVAKGMIMLLLVLGTNLFSARSAAGAAMTGKVTFVGTLKEYHTDSGGYQARFRIRLSDSTCTNQKNPKDRWIEVRSGRMDGAYAHNMANVRNAFSVVLAAFLSGKTVQVDLPTCETVTIDLWSSTIGIF